MENRKWKIEILNPDTRVPPSSAACGWLAAQNVAHKNSPPPKGQFRATPMGHYKISNLKFFTLCILWQKIN
jgi:hypothetical protein